MNSKQAFEKWWSDRSNRVARETTIGLGQPNYHVIDAFQAAWDIQQKEIEKLKTELTYLNR